MRMIIQPSYSRTRWNDDEVADDEPHDPDSEPENDTTEANPKDLNEQEESIHDADSAKRRTRRRTGALGRLRSASKWNCVVDPQTEDGAPCQECKAQQQCQIPVCGVMTPSLTPVRPGR